MAEPCYIKGNVMSDIISDDIRGSWYAIPYRTTYDEPEFRGDYTAQFNAPHKAPKPKAHKGPNPWHSRRKAPMPVIERV